MVSHKIFKRVLVEYFRYILIIEGSCGNECCLYLPDNTIWFNLLHLDNYFHESDIPSISCKYFKKIDPDIKSNILERFPHLKPYFKEHLWFKKKDPTYNIKSSTSNSSMASSFQSGKSSPEYHKPSTLGYKSPVTQSLQNSPI